MKEISEAAGVGESEVKQTLSFRNQQILPLESSLQDDGLTLLYKDLLEDKQAN